MERENLPALVADFRDEGGEGYWNDGILGNCGPGLTRRSVDHKNAPPRPIKVVDRRKFTADGDPREDSGASRKTVEEEHPVDPGANTPETPAVDPAAGQASEAPPTDIEISPLFLELIAMLAQQAELMLVGAEDLPAQPAEARRLIDYLAVIEEKTKGNLSADEARALSEVVFQLRSEFLQRT